MSQKITNKKTEQITEYVNYLVEWVKLKVKQANCEGVIFGLSGGVDSAVVARIGQMAFPENHLALLIPCESVLEDEKLGLEVVDTFGMKHQTINLNKIYKAFIKTLKFQATKELPQLNIKPRLRMTTLYAVAQEKKYLVLGTDNIDELYIGYFTKYGDGASDIDPIANLLKNQVFALGKYLEIPHSILIRQPTAGLYKGQTDESDLGFSYDQLDDYLQNKPVGRIIAKKIRTLHQNSEHKRNMPASPDKYLFKEISRIKNAK